MSSYEVSIHDLPFDVLNYMTVRFFQLHELIPLIGIKLFSTLPYVRKLKDERVLVRTAPEIVCYKFSQDGHLSLLQWAQTRGYRYNVDFCMNGAAENGHLEVLKWLRDADLQQHQHKRIKGSNFMTDFYTGKIQTIAGLSVARGHIHILEWALANGARMEERLCWLASRNGQLETLMWLRAKGCPWDEDVCADPANLTVLKWARENGAPWNENTCTNAAISGKLDILQWARSGGCPWDKQTWIEALETNDKSVLKWLEENGCPRT